MQIYNYDRATGEYLNTSVASPNPLEDGEFLMPADSTTTAPLSAREGYAVVLNGSDWEYVEDNRGIAYNIREEVDIFVLGALSDGITKVAVPFTDEEIASEAATLYSRERKAKYDLLNQDEMRFDDQVNSTTTWVDAINAIKAAHPKP